MNQKHICLKKMAKMEKNDELETNWSVSQQWRAKIIFLNHNHLALTLHY